jgi:hypothetical protein
MVVEIEFVLSGESEAVVIEHEHIPCTLSTITLMELSQTVQNMNW